jgi:caa(3)-type oxidase subunit IV
MAHEATAPDHHPGPRQYVVIGVILAILTGLEVGVFFLELTSALMVAIFLTLSFAKLVLVVGYFMHLKFDDSRFTALFVVPFVIMIAIAVALVALFDGLTR